MQQHFYTGGPGNFNKIHKQNKLNKETVKIIPEPTANLPKKS